MLCRTTLWMWSMTSNAKITLPSPPRAIFIPFALAQLFEFGLMWGPRFAVTGLKGPRTRRCRSSERVECTC